MRRLVIISSTILMIGCASNAKNYAWASTFGTPENFDKSVAECEYDLQLIGKGMDRMTAGVFGMQSPIFEKCMNKHGYKWEKNETK